MIKYATNQCNIRGCTEPIHRHYLCQKHFKQYVSNPIVKNICDEFDLVDQKKEPLSLRFKRIMHHILHYVFDTPMYFVEHFPLEHIFLGNLTFIKQSSKVDFDLGTHLLNDFDYKENDNLPMLKRVLAYKDLANIKIDNKEEYQLQPFELPSFKLIWLCLLGIILTYIAFYTSYEYHNEKFLGFSYQDIVSNGWSIIFVSVLILLMIYSGLKIPRSYNNLIDRAYNLNLFDNPQDNIDVLSETNYVKNRFLKLGSFKASLWGLITGQVFISVIGFMRSSTININTILLFAGFLSIALSLMLIYPILVTYFPIYESIKKKMPIISFTHGDLQGGLHDYLRMQRYVFLYNEVFVCIVITILNIFICPWWLYCIFAFLLLNRANHGGWAMIMSLRSIVNFYKKKRMLIKKYRNIDNEDAIEKIDKLKRIKLFRIPNFIRALFMVIIIPFSISVIANNMTKVTTFFDGLLKFLIDYIDIVSF